MTNETFNKLELQVLELIKYHIGCISEQEMNQENQERIKLLHSLGEMVKGYAEHRNERMKFEEEERVSFMNTRINTTCPQCKLEQLVRIIGEEENEESGLLNDVVQCTVCNTEFIPELPNNWEDRADFSEAIVKMLSKLPANSDVYKALGGKAEVESMIASFQLIKFAHLKVVKEQGEYEKAVKLMNDNVKIMHEYLFLAKMNIDNWNNPIALS